jgi:malonate decarboxylase gamma subunit
MTLDEVLGSMFPTGHEVREQDGLLGGRGRLPGGPVEVIGVAGRRALGADDALKLAAQVLALVRQGGDTPLIVLIDSDSQRMSKRDELLGLNECLAHLAKCVMQADRAGHRTLGLLYGHTAAGAFIATALATRALVALPGAEPAVMDLPSMARVTKLSLDVLREKARSTAVFAPGLDNLAKMGAVDAVLDPARSLAEQLGVWFAQPSDRIDRRDQAGLARGGRPLAAEVARWVHERALATR